MPTLDGKIQPVTLERLLAQLSRVMLSNLLTRTDCTPSSNPAKQSILCRHLRDSKQENGRLKEFWIDYPAVGVVYHKQHEIGLFTDIENHYHP